LIRWHQEDGLGRNGYILCGIGVLFLLAGCAGPGARFPISFSYQADASSAFKAGPSRPKLVVFPLEDKREDPKLIGRHIHLFGQVDTFESTIPVGENLAHLLVASLRQRGWDARLASPGVRPQDITVERVVTGTIQVLWAEAVSRLGYTKIDARFSLNVEILDPRTGEKINSNVENQNRPKVVFFRPELIQKILNELVSSSLNRIGTSSLPKTS
jgi:hypothetical protein